MTLLIARGFQRLSDGAPQRRASNEPISAPTSAPTAAAAATTTTICGGLMTEESVEAPGGQGVLPPSLLFPLVMSLYPPVRSDARSVWTIAKPKTRTKLFETRTLSGS